MVETLIKLNISCENLLKGLKSEHIIIDLVNSSSLPNFTFKYFKIINITTYCVER
jgi:hypothetical protein